MSGHKSGKKWFPGRGTKKSPKPAPQAGSTHGADSCSMDSNDCCGDKTDCMKNGCLLHGARSRGES
jgi:hypothetical protein